MNEILSSSRWSRRSRRLAVGCGLTLALLHLTGSARAADDTDEQLIRKGVEARRQRNDDKALELFKQAYTLRASPRAAAQMGLAEIALGRWVEAEAHLEEAMAARTDPWIKKNKAALEEALGHVRKEVGMLEVLGTPAGAEIIIGGEVRGKLPLSAPIHVRAGDIRIDLRAEGYGPESRTVSVQAGALTRETVALSETPRPIAVSAPAPAERSPDVPTVATSPATAPEVPAPTPHAGAALRATGIVLASVGVAAVSAGIGFGLKARALSTTDSSAPKFDPSFETNGQRYVTLQWVGYGAGAALVVGGAITYFVGLSHRSQTPTADVAFVPTPGGGLASLATTF